LQRLRRNTQNLTQQLRTFENPIGVGTTVTRMKDCRIKNEMRQPLTTRSDTQRMLYKDTARMPISSPMIGEPASAHNN
jgi:hypothetical protein